MLVMSPIGGIPPTRRRGVACITGCDCIMDANDFEAFLSIHRLVRKQMMARMTHWVNRFGKPDVPEKYHGWNRRQYGGLYTMCFVFKYRNDRFDARCYGFKCNPPELGGDLQVFVPVEVVKQKRKNQTDERILRNVADAYADPKVVDCISQFTFGG